MYDFLFTNRNQSKASLNYIIGSGVGAVSRGARAALIRRIGCRNRSIGFCYF